METVKAVAKAKAEKEGKAKMQEKAEEATEFAILFEIMELANSGINAASITQENLQQPMAIGNPPKPTRNKPRRKPPRLGKSRRQQL